MIFETKKVGALMLAGFLLGLGLVQAQTAEGSSLVPSVLAQAEPGVPAEDTRSPAQVLEEAQAALDRMEASADNIGLQLRRAREKKDVVLILCLDDKLNQMNVAARSASDRVASIQAAVSSGNLERARHDDAVLGALAQRGGEIVTEANQCIGEEAGILGRTTLDLTVDPTIPKTDTAAPPVSPMVSTPPVAASPTS